jgi:serine/threonine-protein kinase HipA
MALTGNMEELLKVFRLMIFNIRIENMDDHAKNFSFIYRDDKWQFAPAYDLIKSDGFNGQHSTIINGKGIPEKEEIFIVAKQVGISNTTARRIYDEVMDQ